MNSMTFSRDHKNNRILLGLESYQGDRLAPIRKAMTFLKNAFEIQNCSSIYEVDGRVNKHWNHHERGLSLVLRAETNKNPVELMSVIREIEEKANTTTRYLDIDLLAYESEVLMTPALTLPHPEVHVRPHLLIPAAEVWGDYVHPILQKDLTSLGHAYKGMRWGRFYSSGKTLLDF